MKLPLEITPLALTEIKSIIDAKKIPDGYFLRIGSKGSGCSGVTHYLGFDQKQTDDMVYEHENVTILIKKKDFMHLIGIKLSFINESTQRGFTFE